MDSVREGDVIKIHYIGRLENGQIFESTHGGEPVEFRVGSGNFFPSFEKEIIGMKVGDSKSFRILAEDAFGPRYKELVIEVMKEEFPSYIHPKVGQRLQLMGPDQNPIVVTVTSVEEDTVTLDANHPLAGYALLFDVELLEIQRT